MKKPSISEWTPVGTWMCSLSPVVLWLTFVTLALHIRLGLGHWPTPMADNYPTIAFRAHENLLVALGFFSAYAAAPFWLVLLLFKRLRNSWRIRITQVAVYGLGWLLIFLAPRYDPTTFTAWFLD